MNAKQFSDNNLKDFIRWDSKLELGISLIDNQHRHLVELCNSLYLQLMASRTDNREEWHSSVKGALQECAEYVRIHFHDEELLQKLAGYKFYDRHKAEHDRFTNQIIATVKNYNNMTFTDALKFVRFLYEWILEHVAHEDKLIEKSVKAYLKAHPIATNKPQLSDSDFDIVIRS